MAAQDKEHATKTAEEQKDQEESWTSYGAQGEIDRATANIDPKAIDILQLNALPTMVICPTDLVTVPILPGHWMVNLIKKGSVKPPDLDGLPNTSHSGMSAKDAMINPLHGRMQIPGYLAACGPNRTSQAGGNLIALPPNGWIITNGKIGTTAAIKDQWIPHQQEIRDFEDLALCTRQMDLTHKAEKKVSPALIAAEQMITFDGSIGEMEIKDLNDFGIPAALITAAKRRKSDPKTSLEQQIEQMVKISQLEKAIAERKEDQRKDQLTGDIEIKASGGSTAQIAATSNKQAIVNHKHRKVLVDLETALSEAQEEIRPTNEADNWIDGTDIKLLRDRISSIKQMHTALKSTIADLERDLATFSNTVADQQVPKTRNEAQIHSWDEMVRPASRQLLMMSKMGIDTKDMAIRDIAKGVLKAYISSRTELVPTVSEFTPPANIDVPSISQKMPVLTMGIATGKGDFAGADASTIAMELNSAMNDHLKNCHFKEITNNHRWRSRRRRIGRSSARAWARPGICPPSSRGSAIPCERWVGPLTCSRARGSWRGPRPGSGDARSPPRSSEASAARTPPESAGSSSTSPRTRSGGPGKRG